MAFHPYPQVIRAVFNPHRFGPPLGVTRASPCPWVDRPGFGSTPTNSRALAAGLAFAPAPPQSGLASLVSSNSPDHNAKGTQSGATRVAPRPPSYRLWACGFRRSFTPRPGVLFTCPSRYSSAIGHTRVFSLGGWSPRLHARFHESGVTQELHHARPLAVAYRALTVCGAPFQGTSAGFARARPWVLQPRGHEDPGLGSSRFARRYSGNLG